MGGGYPYSYGYRYWKRNAEEQAQPEYDQYQKRDAEEEAAKPAMLYAGYYGHYPSTLHYGVAGYPYAHHPYALAHPAVTYAHPAVVAPTVAVKPYTYYANSGGAVHIVKREAESNPEAAPAADADAEAAPYYYGYYGHPYRYGGYYGGYGGYYGRRWGGYGYWG